MDRKVGAALAVGIIGVIVGIVGIFMAKDAKDANKNTQAALEKQIETDNQSSAAKVAKAAIAAKAVEKKIQNQASAAENKNAANLKNAENQSSAQVSSNKSAIATLEDKINELTSEIADVEGKQQSNTAKVNARIDQLANRVNGGG